MLIELNSETHGSVKLLPGKHANKYGFIKSDLCAAEDTEQLLYKDGFTPTWP